MAKSKIKRVMNTEFADTSRFPEAARLEKQTVGRIYKGKSDLVYVYGINMVRRLYAGEGFQLKVLCDVYDEQLPVHKQSIALDDFLVNYHRLQESRLSSKVKGWLGRIRARKKS